MGQNGTYGGRDGKTVTVKTLAELERAASPGSAVGLLTAGPGRENWTRPPRR
ncbi:hypothetical protein U5640_24660 [Streptomyces sp. SS7]|uniref:hypothetical protein n=1 Tax=Streptomyces sp. SS7 TaxID=3108485 RepID=UPI0030EB818E